MKKITGIIGGMALMLCMAGCSWQMPEKVSVKTQAEYNFSLGNFEKDFSEDLSIDKLLKDVELPNNGKIYDYWPNKDAKATQQFLMYMPIQEIPIDISQYFDKGTLADNIKNISFEKEIEVPKVDFSFALDVGLEKVNEQITNSFKLAGPIKTYSNSEFGSVLSQFADYLSYEKGYLVVKAYAVNDPTQILSATSVEGLIGSEVDTGYYGTVSISSNGKTISGVFNNGIAEINLANNGGFDFKADDINISFSYTPSIYNPLDGNDYPTKVFIATIDKSREYQIKKVTGLTLNSFDFPVTQEIDALSSLKDGGVEGCTIGEGELELDFAFPKEWENVSASYNVTLTGGMNLSTGQQTTANTEPVKIDLADKAITVDKINAAINFALSLTDATIDFTKKPGIGIESSIREIKAVTVKLSDTSLSFDETQELPDSVLDVVQSIALKQCGIKGTYTNTLPAGNTITLKVFSDFFNIHDSENITQGKGFTLEGDKKDNSGEISILSENESRTVNLSKNPSPTAYPKEFKEFDFKVDVGLPGNDSSKITVQNVKPDTTYKFAINLEPVIDWEAVTVNLDSLTSSTQASDMADTIGTGFNPSSITSSLKDVLGEDFANNIELPDCKLKIYLTAPEIDLLKNLNLSNTSFRMFYGTTPAEGSNDKPTKIGDYEKNILKNGKMVQIDEDGKETYEDIKFQPAPVIKVDEKNDKLVTEKFESKPSIEIAVSDLFTATTEAETEGAQLCVDYNVSFGGVQNGTDEDGNPRSGITIKKTDLENSNSAAGSIGIYAVIELPLSFKIKCSDPSQNALNIDLTKLMKKDENKDGNSAQQTNEDEDIFGRKEASGMDDIKKYIEAIKSVELRYKPLAFPISSNNDIKVDVRLKEGTRDVYTQDFDLSTNKGGTFTIDVDEMEEMLDAYPLKLAANIVVPNNTMISIPREKKVNVNLEIGMETDGKIELFDGKNK